jgi:hypothetical protein
VKEDQKAWVEAIHAMPQDGPDFRWAGPTEICLCGCDLFAAVIAFEDGEVSAYFLDMKCLKCGALLIAPCDENDDEDANYLEDDNEED